MSSVLERIQKLEESMSKVVARITSPDPMLQMTMNKTVGLEQSLTSMGKMLSAISEELSESGALNSAAVMARLRKAEDENSRANVSALLAQDVIEPSAVVNPMSLVALEQKIINTESGESLVLSTYNLIGMNSPAVNAVWKDSLLGKSVGDTVRGLSEGPEEEVLTIKEIYSIKEKEVEGEGEPPETRYQEESLASESEEIVFDSTSEDQDQAGA